MIEDEPGEPARMDGVLPLTLGGMSCTDPRVDILRTVATATPDVVVLHVHLSDINGPVRCEGGQSDAFEWSSRIQDIRFRLFGTEEVPYVSASAGTGEMHVICADTQ